MRVVNDEVASRSKDDPTVVCELVDERMGENDNADPGPEPEDWTPEEDGYGYGV